VPIERAKRLGYVPALELPYREYEPVPSGYHVQEEPRRGLIIAGFILSGVSYGLSAMVAASANNENASGYLWMPVMGPWLTLGLRNYACNDKPSSNSENRQEDWGCLADAVALTMLVMDGMLQAGGGMMVLAGYVDPRKKLVHDSVAWSLAPRLMGTGYGLSAIGSF
jgi:hypothetical protein